MFVVYRCDCGKAIYSDDSYKTHKCDYCNKILKISGRRILYKTDDINLARDFMCELNDSIYHGHGFVRASVLDKKQ